MRFHHYRWVAVVAGTGIAVAIGVGVASGLGATTPSPPPPTVEATSPPQQPSPSTPEAVSVDPSLQQEFGVFRSDAPVAPAQLPNSITSSDIARRFGANPSLARDADSGLFLVPGNGEVCIADEHTVTCGTPENAQAGQLVAIECGPWLQQGEVKLFGAIPDGVTSMQVTSAQGVNEAPVTNNVYSITATSQPTQVSWHDDAGSHTLPIPAEAGQCAAPSAGSSNP